MASAKPTTHIVNINFGFGRGLHERAVKLSGKVDALVFAHYPFVLQVTLVAHQHHWHVICVLHPQDLLPEVLQVVERRLCRYRVH